MQCYRITVVCCIAFMSCNGGRVESPSYQQKLAEAMMEAEKLHGINARLSKIRPYADKRCFESFGCFTKEPFGEFPENPETISATYNLYINEVPKRAVKSYDYNSTFGDEDQLIRQALFDRSRKLVFVAHGFGGKDDLDWVESIRSLLTRDRAANVITINWSQASRYSTLYTTAAANTALIARMTSMFFLRLSQYFNIPVENVHFIGFSLGAQMAGYFGRDVLERSGRYIGRITGLDAASPLFESAKIYPRKGDALFVEGIHTSAGNSIISGRLGVETNYGHVDYYPNGGIQQPGCGILDISCSHSRAVSYYVESLEKVCEYPGCEVPSLSSAHNGKCDDGSRGQRGRFMNYDDFFRGSAEQSIVYVRTNERQPFCGNIDLKRN